jgi:hypothetical protein
MNGTLYFLAEHVNRIAPCAPLTFPGKRHTRLISLRWPNIGTGVEQPSMLRLTVAAIAASNHSTVQEYDPEARKVRGFEKNTHQQAEDDRIKLDGWENDIRRWMEG